MMNNLVFLVAVYFMYSGSILMYRSTCRAGCVADKAYNICIGELWAVKADGWISTIPTYRVYQLFSA